MKEESRKYEADLTWFKIWKNMTKPRKDFSTLISDMGLPAYGVYSILKGNSDYFTGDSFPTYDQLAKMTGIGRSAVAGALKKLTKLGYLKSRPKGNTKHRGQIYTIQESIKFEDLCGGPPAIASWDHIQQFAKQIVTDLQEFRKNGDPNATIVVNIQVGVGNNNHFDQSHDASVNFNHLPDSPIKEIAARAVKNKSQELPEKLKQMEETEKKAARKLE